jgi:hypothetical protein
MMIVNARLFATALLVGTTAIAGPAALGDTPQRSPNKAPFQVSDQAALADFEMRVQAYAELHRRAGRDLPPLLPSLDVGEIRHAIDALATSIRSGRAGAAQGDIFSPQIAAVIRRAVGTGCHEEYVELLALVNDEIESPLPPAAVHARWPDGAPLPTMPFELLAALPRLPAELEYRFMNRDLVLRDLDADLIVDYVPDAIPLVSTAR